MTFRRLALTEELHAQLMTFCATSPELTLLLESAFPFEPAAPEQIAAARNVIQAPEVKVDDDAGVSLVDDGYRVQAWVHVKGGDQ